MAKIMDPILPILSMLGYWAIILGFFGGTLGHYFGLFWDIGPLFWALLEVQVVTWTLWVRSRESSGNSGYDLWVDGCFLPCPAGQRGAREGHGGPKPLKANIPTDMRYVLHVCVHISIYMYTYLCLFVCLKFEVWR